MGFNLEGDSGKKNIINAKPQFSYKKTRLVHTVIMAVEGFFPIATTVYSG